MQTWTILWLTSWWVAWLLNFYGFSHTMVFYRTPWTRFGIPWNSITTSWNSVELHDIPWNSMDTPWEFRGIPWISIDFHGIPWRYFTRENRTCGLQFTIYYAHTVNITTLKLVGVSSPSSTISVTRITLGIFPNSCFLAERFSSSSCKTV